MLHSRYEHIYIYIMYMYIALRDFEAKWEWLSVRCSHGSVPPEGPNSAENNITAKLT